MKVKFLVTCLFVFSQTLGKIKLEVLHPQGNRRLQSGLESIFPEFSNLQTGELSPDVAVKRMENLKERIYDIRDKVLQRLYLVRDYCGYHKIKQVRDAALEHQQHEQEMYFSRQTDDLERSTAQIKAEVPEESKQNSEDKKTETGKETENKGVKVEEKDNDFRTRRLRKLVRELVREEAEKLIPKPASHPQLHNFGKIGMEEEDFDKMDEPVNFTSKQKEQTHHHHTDEEDTLISSKKHSEGPSDLLEEKVLKKLGQA